MNKKKLKLKWVTDTIGNEFYKWKRGDIIKIQAQTGTGKTYFIKKCLIPYMADYERLLYVCNRTNLKRQLKKDLLEQFNEIVPYMKDTEGNYILDINNNKILDVDAIDERKTIGNVTVTSYHAIQNSALDLEYGIASFDLDYNYIVMDECHYILADGSFNNKCRLAFDELIKNRNNNSIKIFISATMEELKNPISKMIKSYFGKAPTLWEYTTGIDYSYVNTKYFKYLKDIIATIKNDKTDNKWLIFISDLKDAKKIKEEIGEQCTIIKAGDTTDELKNIISNSKFECKVLVTTKAMDNGINFSDDKLTNIVIMAWDKITFIQMLGRKRVNIDDAQEVNLFIPTRYKKSFTSKLRDCELKREKVEMFNKANNLFNRQNDNDLKKIAKMEELFYRDNKTGNWALNKVGDVRLYLDMIAFEKIIAEFIQLGKFTFIFKQLEWLELENDFDEENHLENVIMEDDIVSLEKYLENMFDNKIILLRAEDRKELIEVINLIDGHNSNIKENIIKYVKNIKTLNDYLENTLNLNYIIEEYSHSKTTDGKTTRFKASWKIIRIEK